MSLTPTRLLLRNRIASRRPFTCQQCRLYTSTETPASPLMAKLKGDLKTAMKAKDTARLNVLRSILADVTNSAKTSTPIKTDMQLLSLLRKKAAASKSAKEEFEAAGRQDLVDKEEAQEVVFEEYAGSVVTMSESDIRQAVQKVVAEVKAEGKLSMPDMLRRLLGSRGSLKDKPVESSEVAKIVKQVLQS